MFEKFVRNCDFILFRKVEHVGIFSSSFLHCVFKNNSDKLTIYLKVLISNLSSTPFGQCVLDNERQLMYWLIEWRICRAHVFNPLSSKHSKRFSRDLLPRTIKTHFSRIVLEWRNFPILLIGIYKYLSKLYFIFLYMYICFV